MDQAKASTAWRPRTLLFAGLPILVVVLSLMVWATAVSRSGFWADDFFNVTHFSRSLGELSNDDINAGRYVTNIFWAVGTYAFGPASVVPFLLLDSLVLAAGVVTWLRIGSRMRWSPLQAWWIGGLFLATSVWYQTALDSSAIGHASGFLAAGLALLAHERCMAARTKRNTLLWSLAGGGAWTLAVMSNIIYVGLLVIALYCSVHQALKLRGLGLTLTRACSTVASWNLGLPIVYFAVISYPATTSKPQYAANGLQYIHQNLRFYRAQLAPTTALTVTYFAILIGALVGGILAARRRDWFPLALLAAAGATSLPALMQSQQRGIFYFAMPLLLTFSSLAVSVRPLLREDARRPQLVRLALYMAATASLLLLFAQGAEVRSYFLRTPFGGSLAVFRSQVASLTPEGGALCAKLNLNTQQQAIFVAEMSGPDGFLIPPVSAGQAFLVAPGQRCPAQGATTSNITVGIDDRNNFVATP